MGCDSHYVAVCHGMETGTGSRLFSYSPQEMHRNIAKRKKGEIIFLLPQKGSTEELGEMVLSMISITVPTLIGIGFG